MKVRFIGQSLLPVILTLFCAFTRAQQNNKNPAAKPVRFEKLKGQIPLPVDNYKELFTYEQAKNNAKKRYTGCCPSIMLTIRCDSMTIIKNAVEGIVKRVFEIDGTKTILVTHDNYFLVYSNLDTAYVTNGDHIPINQPIGKITTPAYNNLFELEIHLYDKTKAIDPYPWFVIPRHNNKPL